MRQSWVKWSLLLAAAVVVIAGGAFLVISWRPAIAPLASPPDASDRVQVTRGAELAAIGNCITCHTNAGGLPFAGGRPIATPFGTVYATNITPDAESGIGRWSEAAFTRAMRDGVRRDGRHLYPAFPYDHMTKMREADIQAVYAFMMTRRPVRAAVSANDLPFPFNIRALVAGWKRLFLDKDAMQPDPTKSEEWNRGAYLVEGLGHCGACHTPRNALGAEKRNQPYTGGRVRLVRAVSAADSGQAVNPDGIVSQIEGGNIQSASSTPHEAVTFDRRRINSRDWSSYPILRFSEVFENVDVHVIDRLGQLFLGTGEASQGPTAAAIANAIANATGKRIRELPFTRARVKSAIGV